MGSLGSGLVYYTEYYKDSLKVSIRITCKDYNHNYKFSLRVATRVQGQWRIEAVPIGSIVVPFWVYFMGS